MLVACNNLGETHNNISYEKIENGLVGETKLLAQKMAKFACSDDLLLNTTDKEIINKASSFAQTVLQYEEPLSAKRYVIDRNSISDNPSGGAMSHEEVLSLYAQSYPRRVNNATGLTSSATAASLTMVKAYPQPEDFNGIQIIELKYSLNLRLNSDK